MKNKANGLHLISLYKNSSETDRLLFLSSCFSVLLLLVRILYTGKPVFLFLPWNLFLAVVPYVITGFLMRRPAWIENRKKLVPVFLLWLLFIPNSFYILTDLYHLDLSKEAPRWFDLTLIFSFAWNGLLLGILAVNRMETVIRIFLGSHTTLFFVYPVMWLIAFGIYIGRYLRFNSWDVLTSPFALLQEVGEMFVIPQRYTYAWGMIFCFSIFMLLVYHGIKAAHASFSGENKICLKKTPQIFTKK